jgi:hypothetical protein
MMVPTAKLDSVKTEPAIAHPLVVRHTMAAYTSSQKWEITMTSCLRSGVGGLLLYIGKSDAALHFHRYAFSDAMPAYLVITLRAILGIVESLPPRSRFCVSAYYTTRQAIPLIYDWCTQRKKRLVAEVAHDELAIH